MYTHLHTYIYTYRDVSVDEWLAWLAGINTYIRIHKLIFKRYEKLHSN